MTMSLLQIPDWLLYQVLIFLFKLIGNKSIQKVYRWHSQYPGGLKEVKYNEFIKKHPTAVIVIINYSH